jgi:thiol-disulfide isomerase/thioredoxin
MPHKHRSLVLHITWLTLLGCIAAACSGARQRDDATQRKPAPELQLTTLDGASLTLSALRGKVVLIDFWATWCGPCRDEAPKLVELQREYGPRGVQLVGISMDDDAEKVKAFYREWHMNYPVALGEAAVGERFGGVLGLPAKFLVDKQGRLLGRLDTGDPAQLRPELDRLLAE